MFNFNQERKNQMGFNTTVLILNDGLNSIGEDRQFGSKLYEAIINCVTQSRRQGYIVAAKMLVK